MKTIVVVRTRNAYSRFFIASALMAAGAWLAVPSRNEYGNPSMEEKMGECTLTGGETIRLYRGSGGATTSFWYSVTLEEGLLSREKQILFTYAAPELQSIECRGDELQVVGNSFRTSFAAAQLSDAQKTPRAYWRGELQGVPQTFSSKTILRYLLIMALVAASVMVGLRKKK
jgi:hypothetical protein